MTKNLEKKKQLNILLHILFIKICNLLIPMPPKKNIQAIGEAFSPQKRTSNEIYSLFSIFLGNFCPPESGSTPLLEAPYLIAHVYKNT
jgi:hypothetical protein